MQYYAMPVVINKSTSLKQASNLREALSKSEVEISELKTTADNASRHGCLHKEETEALKVI